MAYHKKPRCDWKETPLRKNFDVAGGVVCKGCFEKKLEIDRLRAELSRLKSKIAYGAKTSGQMPVGAHTPPSKLDLKKSSAEELRRKKGGARQGHRGHGRRSICEERADEIVETTPEEHSCPGCGGELSCIGTRERSVIEARPLKAKQLLYRINRYRCGKCRAVVERKPETLPKCLYGNRLLSQAATMHYFHGITIGKLINMYGPNVTEGGLIQALHRLGSFCERALPKVVNRFRLDEVRHADETGWRNDGQSGYAWLFSSDNVSILKFAESRAAHVPKKIFGSVPLKGTLVVDRYGGYNKMPVQLQYCYAHLLREVEKLEQEFPDSKEVEQFSGVFITLLTQAMKLKNLEITNKEYYRRAKGIKSEMKAVIGSRYIHLGIRRIQQIFISKEHRLYCWVKDRRVPAHNNKAERELRPTVIARKVSFGSQSEAGARTRGAITSMLFTAKKRLPPEVALEDWLKDALDQISQNPKLNIYDLLPPERGPDPTGN